MLVEMINRLLDLGEPNIEEIDSLTYCDKQLTLVRPPEAPGVSLLTLTGLADTIRARLDNVNPADWLLLVWNHQEVLLVARHATAHGCRSQRIQIHLHDENTFRFGQFLDREEFIIGLQSKFAQTPDLDAVLKLASGLEASTVQVAEDDGISQKTTVRQGVVLKQQVTVKGRVTLRPYRTFREVEQPASEFVFRLRSQDGQVPTCALFEADGGKWKLDAVLTIKKWLDAQQLGIPVVA